MSELQVTTVEAVFGWSARQLMAWAILRRQYSS